MLFFWAARYPMMPSRQRLAHGFRFCTYVKLVIDAADVVANRIDTNLHAVRSGLVAVALG
jgi:hypothetical protein